MSKMFGLVSLLIVLVIGAYLFKTQMTTGAPKGAAPMPTADVVGVKTDLIAIGQAERMYLISKNQYATLSQLEQGNYIAFSGHKRHGYRYSAQVNGGQSFTLTAVPLHPTPGWPTLSMDASMQITQH